MGFSNVGESIFEAIDHMPIDFLGKTCVGGCSSKFDLSKFLLDDKGMFDARDDVFDRFGSLQTTFRGCVFELVFGGRKST